MTDESEQNLFSIADPNVYDQMKQDSIESLKKLNGPFLLTMMNRRGATLNVNSINIATDGDVFTILNVLKNLEIGLLDQLAIVRESMLRTILGQRVDLREQSVERDPRQGPEPGDPFGEFDPS